MVSLSIFAWAFADSPVKKESQVFVSDVKQGPGAFLSKPTQEALGSESVNGFSVDALDLQVHGFNRLLLASCVLDHDFSVAPFEDIDTHGLSSSEHRRLILSTSDLSCAKTGHHLTFRGHSWSLSTCLSRRADVYHYPVCDAR